LKPKRLLLGVGVLVLAPIFPGSEKLAKSQSVLNPDVQHGGDSSTSHSPRDLSEIYFKGDKLRYRGYVVVRRIKRVHYNYTDGSGRVTSDPVDVSYAVLEKNGVTLAKFEGFYSGFGNATDFGLFSLIGGDSRQLIVSQTIPRGGRHWVVDLSADLRTLFDSRDYGVGREEFGIVDVDGDGLYEISMPVTAFYSMQDLMYIAEIPLPEIVFKYEKNVRKYVPANQLLQNYALRAVDDDIRKLEPNEKRNYLSKRLDILLRYVYAGKEATGWTFFDREYRLSNRETIRARIKAVLEMDAVYRYISRRH
jgi:hypothetical protein